MSGKIIKTDSNAAAEQGRTDWAAISKVSDKAINAAIASDPDAYALDDETLGRLGSAYQYQVFADPAGGYRWRLIAADRSVLASSEQSFNTLSAAKSAIAEVRSALLGGKALAA